MKFEAIIYIVVACLTVVMPSVSYVAFSGWLKQEANQSIEIAKRFEIAAEKIETGEAKAYTESIPTSLRMQAKAEKARASMFLNFDSAATKFFFAAIWIAVLQSCLLFVVLRRKANITQQSTPTATPPVI